MKTSREIQKAHKKTFGFAERLRFWVLGGGRRVSENDSGLLAYFSPPVWKRFWNKLRCRLVRAVRRWVG